MRSNTTIHTKYEPKSNRHTIRELEILTVSVILPWITSFGVVWLENQA